MFSQNGPNVFLKEFSARRIDRPSRRFLRGGRIHRPGDTG
jgi:hypothetical protein